MQTIQKQKSRLRQDLKAERATITQAMKGAMDKRLCKRLINLPQISAARSLFCFVSMPAEVETHALLKALLEAGKSLSVPKITPDKTMLAVKLPDWEQLGTGEMGILTTRSSAPYTDKIDVCITPGLGFSEQGERIGFGRGYYDSWFQEHPDTLKIALAYECQIVAAIPTDENDVPVNLIVTEDRLIRID